MTRQMLALHLKYVKNERRCSLHRIGRHRPPSATVGHQRPPPAAIGHLWHPGQAPRAQGCGGLSAAGVGLKSLLTNEKPRNSSCDTHTAVSTAQAGVSRQAHTGTLTWLMARTTSLGTGVSTGSSFVNSASKFAASRLLFCNTPHTCYLSLQLYSSWKNLYGKLLSYNYLQACNGIV